LNGKRLGWMLLGVTVIALLVVALVLKLTQGNMAVAAAALQAWGALGTLGATVVLVMVTNAYVQQNEKQVKLAKDKLALDQLAAAQEKQPMVVILKGGIEAATNPEGIRGSVIIRNEGPGTAYDLALDGDAVQDGPVKWSFPSLSPGDGQKQWGVLFDRKKLALSNLWSQVEVTITYSDADGRRFASVLRRGEYAFLGEQA
jgi:hypothetical protein